MFTRLKKIFSSLRMGNKLEIGVSTYILNSLNTRQGHFSILVSKRKSRAVLDLISKKFGDEKIKIVDLYYISANTEKEFCEEIIKILMCLLDLEIDIYCNDELFGFRQAFFIKFAEILQSISNTILVFYGIEKWFEVAKEVNFHLYLNGFSAIAQVKEMGSNRLCLISTHEYDPERIMRRFGHLNLL